MGSGFWVRDRWGCGGRCWEDVGRILLGNIGIFGKFGNTGRDRGRGGGGLTTTLN